MIQITQQDILAHQAVDFVQQCGQVGSKVGQLKGDSEKPAGIEVVWIPPKRSPEMAA